MSISPQSFHCVVPNCSCSYFASNVTEVRLCSSCNHTWFAHAISGCSQSDESDSSNPAEGQTPFLALSSLVLFGVQAIPIRLRILLDKLLCVLHHGKVFQLLLSFDWSYDDYVRGYKLKDSQGNGLNSWSTVTFTEEKLIMYQFLKFNWTKPLAQSMILQQASECTDFNFYNNLIASAKTYEFTYSQLLARFYPDLFNFYSPFRFLRPERFWPLHSLYLGCFPPNEMSNSPSGNEADASSVHPCASNASADEMNYLLKLREASEYNCSSAGERSDQVRTFASSTSKECNESEISKLSFMSESPVFSEENSSKQLLLAMPQSQFGSRKTSTSECSPMRSNFIQSRDDYKFKSIKRVGNLVRRPWQTTLGYGGILVSNGKKRVLCSACNKTFCDKGALKIHYSAVHLKEMHRCTIEGCNMLFSSRRSRNRHSANPNTKLHMDHKRRNQMTLGDGRQLPKIYPNATTSCMKAQTWGPSSTTNIPLRQKSSFYDKVKVTDANCSSRDANHSSDSSGNTNCSEAATLDSESCKSEAAKGASEVRANKRKNLAPVKLVAEEVQTGYNPAPAKDRGETSRTPVKLEGDSKACKQESQRDSSDRYDLLRPGEETNFCFPRMSYYAMSSYHLTQHKNPCIGHVPTPPFNDSTISRDYGPAGKCYQVKLSPTEGQSVVIRGEVPVENAGVPESFVCQISGCNASFPSKRSRDRHSSNVLLHRKLLSTSSNCFSRDILSFKMPTTTRYLGGEGAEFGARQAASDGSEKHLNADESAAHSDI